MAGTSAPAHDWSALAKSPQFLALRRSKAAFIVPACLFFVAYYFALPVLVGYAPELMKTKVWGPLNVAYVFALSQFFMAWAIAALYVRSAGRSDEQAAAVRALAQTSTQGGRR